MEIWVCTNTYGQAVYAEKEKISPKKVAALVMQLISNDENDYTVSNICKEIVETGTFGSTKRELKHSSCSLLLDHLSLVRENRPNSDAS